MTTIALHDRVVVQARLLVRLLATISHDGDRGLELPGPAADIAELLFEGLAELHEATMDCDLVDAPERPAAVSDEVRLPSYPALVQRVRTALETGVPPGSTVAVITRGDSSLVQLAGLRGRHFPQNPLGVWAGFHPATGRDAVAHLEELRRSGVEYLAIPAPSSWWMDFYGELRDHLRVHAQVVVDDGDVVVFCLGDVVADPAPIALHAGYEESQVGFAELLEVLLPDGAKVLVVSRGDPAWLALGARLTRHFPSTTDGTYMGHPADDADALRALRSSIALGAEYLAIPAPLRWWDEVYSGFVDHLRRNHRLLADHAEVGVLFELVTGDR